MTQRKRWCGASTCFDIKRQKTVAVYISDRYWKGGVITYLLLALAIMLNVSFSGIESQCTSVGLKVLQRVYPVALSRVTIYRAGRPSAHARTCGDAIGCDGRVVYFTTLARALESEKNVEDGLQQ